MTAFRLALPDTGGINLRLRDDDFEYYRTALHERAGIVLSDAKRDLLKSRLRARVLELGLGDLARYRAYLAGLPSGHPEWQTFVNLMTTNKTEWFREPDHFAFLTQEFLPKWTQRAGQKRRLRVWCAASSTGEEPYTLALVLAHHLGSPDRFELVASDIDTSVLAHAANGVYPRQRTLASVPPQYHREGFAFGTGDIKDWVRVKRAVKDRVSFVRLNLLEHPFPFAEPFDLIFCRNVFIYFSAETIARIVDAQFDAAKPHGALVIGHSETLQAPSLRWRYLKPSIYVRGAPP